MIEKVNDFNFYEGGGSKIEAKEYQEYLKPFAEEILIESQEIGEGKSARVFEDPLNNCCYKIITNTEKLLHLPDEEADFLQKVQNEYVKVPQPLFSLSVTEKDAMGKLLRKYMLGMEKIHGVSLRQIMSGTKPLPEHVDPLFFKKIELFLKDIHEKGIHHRDLHEGNIMIDEDGQPVVIDFGLSCITHGNEDPYKDEYATQGKVLTYLDDMNELKRITHEFEDFIKTKQLESFEEIDAINYDSLKIGALQKVGIKEHHTFFEDITKAVSEMSDDVSVVSIPNSFGLFLVADNSKELEERKEDHSVMYPKTIDGKKYFICRR